MFCGTPFMTHQRISLVPTVLKPSILTSSSPVKPALPIEVCQCQMFVHAQRFGKSNPCRSRAPALGYGVVDVFDRNPVLSDYLVEARLYLRERFALIERSGNGLRQHFYTLPRRC